MGNKKKNFYQSLGFVGIAAGLILLFQNCGSNNVRFADLKSYGLEIDLPGTYTAKIGSTTFPPLKLIMVLDNSASMDIHNNNLSAPLAAMFNSANSGNLSEFDATVYILTTTQSSQDIKYYPATTVNFSQLSALPINTVVNSYRNKTLTFLKNSQSVTINNAVTGELPGDIFGFSMNQSNSSGVQTTLFRPAPMLFLNSSGSGTAASLGLNIPKGTNPSTIQQVLSSQLDLLSSNRRDFKFDNNTDGPVNRESGLCAVARVLRNNQGIINPGDVVSFLIASDEADNDPSGNRCIDSLTTSDGQTDLYDYTCQGTRFNYERHECRISYWSGYNVDFRYSYFPMDVSYRVETTIQLGDGLTDIVFTDRTASIDSTGLSCNQPGPVISRLPSPGSNSRIVSINSCSVSSTALTRSGNQFTLYFSNFSTPSLEPALGNCLNDSNVLNNILTRNSSISSLSSINYCNITRRNDSVTRYPGGTLCAITLQSECSGSATKRECTVSSDSYAADRKDDSLRGGLTCNSLASETSLFTSLPGTVNDVIAQTYLGRNCTSQAYTASTQTKKLVNYACPGTSTRVTTRGPYRDSSTQTEFLAGTVNNAPKSDLITYIKNQSSTLLGSTLPHISVFDDTSAATHYDSLITTLGGIESSISATNYSAALNNLSHEISRRLSRSIQVPSMSNRQIVRQVTKNGVPLTPLTEWTSSGNTVTISDLVTLQIGDEIKIDYE